MSVNRFFIPRSSIEGGQVRLSPEQAHQISHVLRLKQGDTIVVLDGIGAEYDVALTKVGFPETVGEVAAERHARGEPRARLTLFQSLLSRGKFEWVLQKGTEVGVTEFVPVLTQRSVVRAGIIEEPKLERWRRILIEAAEQSRRGCIPKLDPPIAFSEAAARFGDFDHVLLAASSPETVSLGQVLTRRGGSPSSLAVCVGPEGGFTQDELALAREQGATPLSLGPRILRTETAAVVACALALYELGEMGPRDG